MIKVAIILNSLSNTGPNITSKDLIDSFFESEELYFDVFYLKDTNFNTLNFNKNCIKINFFNLHLLRKYDIIHTSTLLSDFFVFFLKNSIYRNKIYVTWFHNLVYEDLNYSYNKFVSKFFGFFWIKIKFKFNGIIFSSISMYNYYESMIKLNLNFKIINYGRDISIVDNYIENNIINQINRLKCRFKIIGTCGSLTLRKNYIEIIDILNHDFNYAWICIGIGDQYNYINDVLDKHNLSDRVIFLGFVNDSRIYYKYFDLFFHPSKSEGFSLAIIDSMANRIPILIPELDIYKSHLSNDMVFYYKKDNYNSLIEIFNSTHSKEEVNTKVENSYLYYLKKFSMSRMRYDYLHFLKYLLKHF